MDTLLGALGGFAFVTMLIAVWKGIGTLLDRLRVLAALDVRLQKVERAPASKTVEDLADRVAKLERKLAEVDLQVLDTAEKVAAKLADRQRKRERALEEIGDVDEIPDDPAVLLARARAAYPLPSMPAAGDPAQLALNGVR